MRFLRVAFALAIFCAALRTASGIVFVETGDPARNTSTPGDNSGWQYEGTFNGYLGTPIAPLYFITAKHIGGGVGDFLVFHGEAYKTTAAFPDPSSDLQIWQVADAKPFPCYAPLCRATTPETGRELRVHGRGTQRGADISLDGTLRGWAWGPSDYVERWGRNLVSAVVPAGDSYPGWVFLQQAFDSPGLPDEAHLTNGDSGGSCFILEDGLWRLAGINYGVDDLYSAASDGAFFVAAIFDARGYYAKNDDGTFSPITGAQNVPTSWYCTQISSRLGWITGITGVDPAALPAEGFDAWKQEYFTPSERADGTVSGPDADPDGDGVSNLLEYAFNLDPTFAEPVVMAAGTGVRGLPAVRLETGADRRLTVEFVRRTAGSGAGLTYAVQFTASLEPGAADWQTGGTESVAAINPRWERVKVTDSVPVGGAAAARFARVVVTQAVPRAAQAAGREQGRDGSPSRP